MAENFNPQPAAPFTAPLPVSPSDERTWGMLAHLSVLLNLVTGFLGPVAALIIYLVYKDRSRIIAYHSLQSLIFQSITWIGGGLLTAGAWIMSGILSAVFIGIFCIPFACLFGLIPLAGVVYGVVGAVQTSQGQDFRYWLVGDWVRGTLVG